MTNDPPSDPQAVSDPHGLLAGGEELATPAELARLLSCSARMLHELFEGPLYGRVRCVRCKPGPWRYSVNDARTAIEPYRGEIEARRARAAELEASQRAAKAAKIAASQVAAPKPAAAAPRAIAKPTAKTTAKSAEPPPISKSKPRVPEVVFVARGGAPRKPEEAKT